jgi:hypothetical protein
MKVMLLRVGGSPDCDYALPAGTFDVNAGLTQISSHFSAAHSR